MSDSQARIYIVEDDEGIGEVYEEALSKEYRVHIFPSGGEFFAALDAEHPDLILLDLMLPDMDGYTILGRIRARDPRVPVIIVSAKGDEISFVKGLNRGADDYMKKPFSVLELMARIRSHLRRANLFITSVGDFSIDKNTYRITYRGEDLRLTLKEFKLLRALIGHAGVTVDREDLFREVWGDGYIGETRTLDMHMATLREKIKQGGCTQECIVTVRGIGYRFESV